MTLLLAKHPQPLPLDLPLPCPYTRPVWGENPSDPIPLADASAFFDRRGSGGRHQKAGHTSGGRNADPVEDQKLCGGIIRGKPRVRKDQA